MGTLRARWRGLLIGVAVAVVVAALAVWTLPYAGVPLSDGPIRPSNPHGTAIDTFDVGDRFTYGLNTVRLTGTQSAVIKEVEVIGLDDGVKFLGARLGGPDRRLAAWQVLKSWPPRDPRTDPRPLGTPITPDAEGRDWELFIGLEITEPGRFLSEGWRITYEVEGRTYRHTIPARVLICTRNEDGSTRSCPAPDPF